MAIERTIDIESISFSADTFGGRPGRSATVLWRISTPGTDHTFTVPIRIMVTREYPETEVVKYARAALHLLMASVANQTTPWRIEAEKGQ